MLLPESRRRPECGCCGSSRVEALCDWPIEGYVRTPVRDVVDGDRVRRFTAKPNAKTYAVVEKILRRYYPGPQMHMIGLHLRIHRPKTGPAPDLYVVKYTDQGVCLAYRKSLCAVPVCVECLREVGEDRHYCRSHWNAWEVADVSNAETAAIGKVDFGTTDVLEAGNLYGFHKKGA